MCGFVGYIDGGETQLMEPVLHAMADRIRHRGPDDADYYMDGEISLGFRRLSIIDLEATARLSRAVSARSEARSRPPRPISTVRSCRSALQSSQAA